MEPLANSGRLCYHDNRNRQARGKKDSRNACPGKEAFRAADPADRPKPPESRGLRPHIDERDDLA